MTLQDGVQASSRYTLELNRTCVTIWLISIAFSAGFSQPLLLMTSTIACSASKHVLSDLVARDAGAYARPVQSAMRRGVDCCLCKSLQL